MSDSDTDPIGCGCSIGCLLVFVAIGLVPVIIGAGLAWHIVCWAWHLVF